MLVNDLKSFRRSWYIDRINKNEEEGVQRARAFRQHGEFSPFPSHHGPLDIAVDQNSKDEKRTEDQVQWPSTDRKRSSLSNDVQHRGEDNLTRARIGSVKKTYKIYNQCN